MQLQEKQEKNDGKDREELLRKSTKKKGFY